MSATKSPALARASVIITRPVGQGRALARQVRALGGLPVLLPAVALRAMPVDDALRQALRAALAGDWVLFTSPSAVRFAARVSPLRGRARVATVGQGTAHVLARHGVKRVLVPATQTSEGLLDQPDLADLAGRRVAVVGAPGGRGLLQQTLRERGAAVTDLAVYQRVPARLDARHRQALRHLSDPAYLLVSSVQVLRQLQATLGADWSLLARAVAVASSPRVAQAAVASGFTRVEQASSAHAGDLLARTIELARAGRELG